MLDVVAPWRLFGVTVRAVRRLGPSFVRVTFTGPDLDRFADNGFDQRVKLAFPLPGADDVDLPGDGPDWYRQWRARPAERRNPIRTYTVRAVRPQLSEVDIDLVLHGDGGPASRWARRATPGDRIAIVGPDAGFTGDHGGVEFHPPHSGPLLLAGDETAAPAICAILAGLPADAHGRAFVEVPHEDDALPVAAPERMAVTWLTRGNGPRGSLLIPAVQAAVPRMAGGRQAEIEDVDVDRDILWEVPDAAPTGAELYAWLAGEAGVIRRLRRYLVNERGLDRSAVAFMGYWRLGRTEGERPST
jgi:NADPH-dependent ferric siderophore reductase